MYRFFCFLAFISLTPFALAHHSMAEYDFDVTQELQGEVVSLNWRNPHVELTLRVRDSNGVEADWEIEAQDVNTMSRRGLTAELIDIGDNIRVAGHASKRQVRNMSVTNLLLTNGTEIRFRGDPKPRWETERIIGFGSVDVEKLLAGVDTQAGKAQGLFRVWMRAKPGGFSSELPLTESALAHLENWKPADDPNIECTVPGMPVAMRLTPPHPIDLTEQENGDILMRIEFFDIVRTIHMNSEAESLDRAASALGYSEGSWEGDVLVVDTSLVNWPFLDTRGKIPISESVIMHERFELSENGNQMTYELAVTDPSSFTETLNASWLMDWRPDIEIQKYDCILPESQ